MPIRSRYIIPANLAAGVLLVLPSRQIDLLNDNYSTLSMTAEGHLYLLVTGALIGILLSYEAGSFGSRYRRLLFPAVLLSVAIPHHYPYDLQGNLHLLLAYASTAFIVTVTYHDLFLKGERKAIDLFVLSLGASAVLCLHHSFVNLLSELIIIASVLISYLYLYRKYG